MNLKYIALFLVVVFCSSCGNSRKEAPGSNYSGMDPEALSIPEEAMNEVIGNIGSPIEVALLLNELQVPFSAAYLSHPEKMNDTVSGFDLAYKLGILNSNLGYFIIYNMSGSSISHLEAIRDITVTLDLEEFFNFKKLERLASRDNNTDSLLFVSMNSFNRKLDHLRSNDRGSLATMMVAGVWIEGLYLATQAYKQSEADEIRTMIGEQKHILSDLLIIMQRYKTDPNFNNLYEDYLQIRKRFDKVKITYKIGEPETVEVDGMLMVIQNETTTMDLSDKTLSDIIEITEEIRNKHLNI
ncbi:MAG: hypothetical protein WD578_07150 [Bacteroidales bacterium]